MILLLALKDVFKKPGYVILACFAAFAIFAMATWLPNLSLIGSIFDSNLSLGEKIMFLINLLGSISTNFSALSATYTIAIAILFGINLSMLVFFLKRRIREEVSSGLTTGTLGTIAGVLGVGCAACGSFLLLTILSWFGAGWLIAALPLRGSEFGILGVALLSLSLWTTAKKIRNPAICRV